MNRKKKILFYIDTLGKGGLDKVVLDVANNLDYDKYEVSVIRRFSKGYYTEYLNREVKTKSNMPFQNIKHPRLGHMVRVLCDRLPRKMIYRLFIHKKYDIEIACGDSFAATLIGGSTNKNSKKILWEHMDVTKDESTATYYNKTEINDFFKPFDRIIGVSKDCKDKFIEKYGFKDKTSYIYNPINRDEIIEKSKYFIPEEYKRDSVNIVAIGRLMPQKAFVRLVKVLEKVKEVGINFNLFILGEGPEEAKIKEEIAKRQLNNNISLLGFQDNPYPYIYCADFLINASIHESYCLVVAESLVLGTPIVATKCAGPVELLGEGEYGLLVDNNEEALEQGIITFLSDEEQYNNYKEKAKVRGEIFSVEKCINEWEKIFDEE